MSWAKVVGGAVGALFGGPIGAGVGVLIGAGWDDADRERGSIEDGGLTSERIGSLGFQQTGNALTVAGLIPTDIDADTAVIRIAQAGSPVESFVPDFKDTDGTFALTRHIEGASMSVDLPLHALVLRRNAAVEIQVVVALFSNGEYMGHLAEATSVRVGFEPWSVVGWLAPAVDLLAHHALRHGPWTGPKVQRIKAVFAEFGEPTSDEAAALRDRLKLVTRPALEDCVCALLRRSRQERVIDALLRGSADLLTLSGCSQLVVAKEIGELCDLLGATDSDVGDSADDGEEDQEADGAAGNGRAEAGTEASWARSVLSVELGASPEAIKQAWRRKITDLHPDKYANLPEAVQSLIKEKAQEVNRARDVLTA